MNRQINKALRAETKIAWGITKDSGFSYDPQGFWLSLEKRMNDIPLTDNELANYMKAYVVCTILEINLKWPQKENEGKNSFQASIMSMVVADLMEFYEKDPQKYLFNYIKTLPTTDDEKRHLHRHIKGKARLQILSALKEVQAEERDPALKPKKVKKEKKDGIWMDTEKDEYLAPQSFSIDAKIKHDDGESGGFDLPDERYLASIELSETDYFILASQENSNFSKIEIQNEVQSFFTNFYLENRNQLKIITPYFTNISFFRIRTKDIWTTNKLVWKAIDVWNRLVKIDKRLELSDDDKGILYHFYLVICISAMKQKRDDSIITPSSSASQSIVISRPVADALYLLIVKTFLYFTSDIKKKVFSRVIDPPPVSDSDISKFSNAIKDKPRDLLKKSVKIPKNIFPPAPPVTAKLMSTVEQSIFSENFNLHELFESYEVFEYLTEKVKKAFETGELESEETADTTDLKAFLSENKIELDTIFNFLNPESQKEKQDYSYITQGTISAITTAIMSSFKKDGDSLYITLTNGESSLNTEKLAEASAFFLKTLIEKDFVVKRGDVSELAKSVVADVVNEIDVPFSIPIPSDSEYESFKSMIEMNGPIKVKVPFSTQGDQPFWEKEKVLDDKMVQLLEASIKEAINQADIGKAILKHL